MKINSDTLSLEVVMLCIYFCVHLPLFLSLFHEKTQNGGQIHLKSSVINIVLSVVLTCENAS